jgi:hypothetical protein
VFSVVVFILVLAVWVLIGAVAVLLTRQPPFKCPPSQAILATVKRHAAALPVLACLSAAGIDACVTEETAKPFAWRLLYRFMIVGYFGEPPGPWHVVVPQVELGKAQACVGR